MSRCRRATGTLGGRCAGTEARQTAKHQTQVTDAPEPKTSTGILRSVELIHGWDFGRNRYFQHSGLLFYPGFGGGFLDRANIVEARCIAPIASGHRDDVDPRKIEAGNTRASSCTANDLRMQYSSFRRTRINMGRCSCAALQID